MSQQLLILVSAFGAPDDGAIHAYQLDLASGKMQLVDQAIDIGFPFFMAVSPDRRFLYGNHAPEKFGGEQEQIFTFTIDQESGVPKLLSRTPSPGRATCYVDIAPSGKALVVAHYLEGSVASYRIGPDGTPGEAVSLIKHKGSSVDPKRQEGPHAHCSVVSPDGRFVLAADLGMDQVLCYRLDPETAQLLPNDPPFAKTAPGAGPRHLTFHPNGKLVYVINELDNTILALTYDSKSGALNEFQTISTLPDDHEGETHTADVKITPDGRHLFGTNRGHDSLAIYEISDDGRLALVEFTPSLGEGPQNLAITPGGEVLLCANMAGDCGVVFAIDSATGRLTPLGEPIPVTKPSCIMIL